MAAYREKHRDRVREYQRRWKAANPEAVRAYARAVYRRDPAKYLAKHRKRKYGLTAAAVRAILNSQGGVCAICAASKPGGRGDWHLDHDHGTRKPRGLLCAACNKGLGHFSDDANLLRAAAHYLEKHAT
jgi:hypothetical protein